MKFTYEEKIKLVEQYLKDEVYHYPEGMDKRLFSRTLQVWVKRYKDLGPESLKRQPNRKLTAKDRLKLVKKVLNGESIQTVAVNSHIHGSQISLWVRNYKKDGLDGLEYNNGRKSKYKPMKTAKQSKKKLTKDEELKFLREQNKNLEMEITYLKKLDALVSKREDAEGKAKKQK